MKWSAEAEKALSKVPFFVRKRVRKKVEEEALRAGAAGVCLGDVMACKRKFLHQMEEEVRGYRIESCFGPDGCPNRVVQDDDMARRMEAVLSRKNLKAFLNDRVQGPLKMHHEFQVTLADCPNACSRPQITDIGIIGARQPGMTDAPCNHCGACVEICREEAILLADTDPAPSIDSQKCLSCGQCIMLCPTGTLAASRQGYRIFIGGKLGRHPHLAQELHRIFSKEETLRIVDLSLNYYMAHNRTGERFGEILKRRGLEDFRRFLNDKHPDLE